MLTTVRTTRPGQHRSDCRESITRSIHMYCGVATSAFGPVGRAVAHVGHQKPPAACRGYANNASTFHGGAPVSTNGCRLMLTISSCITATVMYGASTDHLFTVPVGNICPTKQTSLEQLLSADTMVRLRLSIRLMVSRCRLALLSDQLVRVGPSLLTQTNAATSSQRVLLSAYSVGDCLPALRATMASCGCCWVRRSPGATADRWRSARPPRPLSPKPARPQALSRTQ
jgi:hypothetical protein